MTAKLQQRAWILCGCFALVGACFCAAQQDPLAIRVEPGRVVVPVAWSGQVTTGGLGGWGPQQCTRYSGWCWWDDVSGRVSILDENAITPFSLGILSSDKFKLFEDGKQQQIDSVHEVINRDIQVWLDNLGAHREASFGTRGIWSTSDQAPAAIAANAEFSHLFLITYTPQSTNEGGCHEISVKPHEGHLIYSKKYCGIPPPIPDPPQVGPEGSKLEAYITARKPGSIHPLAQSSAFYEGAQESPRPC